MEDSISVVMAVHNEEKYLPTSLNSLETPLLNEIICILDRCTDSSEAIIKSECPRAKIRRKDSPKWENSYAENLQIGLEAVSGDILCVLDADIKTSPGDFAALLAELKSPVASVSPIISTYKNASVLSFLYHYWEKTYRLTPYGREPRGGFRLIKTACLKEVGGFKDVEAPDTQLDADLRRKGYESKLVEGITCQHLRAFSFWKAARGQVASGKMRRRIKTRFWKVLAHSLIRLRPLVIYGYLKGPDRPSSK